MTPHLRPTLALCIAAIWISPAAARTVTATLGCESVSNQYSSQYRLWPRDGAVPAGATMLVTMHGTGQNSGNTSLEDRPVQNLWPIGERRTYAPYARMLFASCEAQVSWDDPNAAPQISRAIDGPVIRKLVPLKRKIIRKPMPKR
ncbi:hypothetical protein ACVWZA_004269 [Sphingomonas sp. UYAg733]